MIFYLGTNEPAWLKRVSVPLFLSRRRLARLKSLPRALGPWALDSGGFTELQQRGSWSITPEQYAAEVRRYRDEVGRLQWAAIMDWMCEEMALAKTRLSIVEHQRRTIQSYLDLQQLAPELPWVPVLQGWGWADYMRHQDAYDKAGVDLFRCPIVGVGSVCRRQHTDMICDMIQELRVAYGLCLHAFGFKLAGLRKASRYLSSADSMAWSKQARESAPLPGCTHRACNSCLRYALWWRENALRAADAGRNAPYQPDLFGRPVNGS